MNARRWGCLAPILVAVSLWACGKSGLELDLRYRNVNGLKAGDRVVMDGTPAGRVTRVAAGDGGNFTVTVEIDPDFAASATDQARFVIVEDPGVAGQQAVAVFVLRPGGTPLADKSVVDGATRTSVLVEKWQADLQTGLDELNRRYAQWADKLQKIPVEEAVSDMKRLLDELAHTMQEAGDSAREHIRKEVLPKVQREFDRLRDTLRGMGREGEAAPLETQLENLRRT